MLFEERLPELLDTARSQAALRSSMEHNPDRHPVFVSATFFDQWDLTQPQATLTAGICAVIAAGLAFAAALVVSHRQRRSEREKRVQEKTAVDADRCWRGSDRAALNGCRGRKLSVSF